MRAFILYFLFSITLSLTLWNQKNVDPMLAFAHGLLWPYTLLVILSENISERYPNQERD